MLRHKKLFEQLAKLKQLKLRHSLRQETGAVLIFTALAIPVLLGLTGIAFDVGNLYMHKARLQNVADAAALAGARAYADSQANPENDPNNIRDSLDNYNTEGAKNTVDYSINNSTPLRDYGNTPHPNADKAADDYIYKNRVNLGNTVTSDPFSHYALLSKEAAPKIFYRVGLYEYVDLYFLPVIRGIPKRQKVGVEAIVKLTEDTGDPIPATIFSNLYTYSENLSVSGAMSGSNVQTTFDGTMIYTGESGTFFETDSTVNDLFTTGHTKNNPTKSTIFNKGGIDESNESYLEYLNIFKTKLSLPHVTIDMANSQDRENFTIANINQEDSILYKFQEKDPDNHLVYTIKYKDQWNAIRSFTYSIDPDPDVPDDRKFYSYDKEGDIMFCLPTTIKRDNKDIAVRIPTYLSDASSIPFTYDDNNTNRTYNGNYVKDSDEPNRNNIYYTIKDVTNNNNNVTNSYVYFATKQEGKEKGKYRTNAQIVALAKQHFKYAVSGVNIIINFLALDESLFDESNRVPLMADYNTNLFLLKNSGDASTTVLDINNKITGRGNANEPIYIFDETGQEMQVTVTANNERPIAIIHNNNRPVTITVNEGKTFDGVIYAPNATCVINLNNNSSFRGNIVAKNISTTNCGGSSSFIQKNHLEGDTDLYSEILKHAKDESEILGDSSSAQSGYDKPPTTIYNAAWKNWYRMVGKQVASDWFNSLNDSQKNSFWKSWDYDERPQNAEEGLAEYEGGQLRNLWYYGNGENDYGNWKTKWDSLITSEYIPDSNIITAAKGVEYFVRDSVFDTKVRLINPRLEFNPFTEI